VSEALPMWKRATGEPYAGEPPVRFGGRGTPPLSASLKPAQTLPGDGSLAVLKAALGKKAGVEMLLIRAGTAPHGVTRKFSRLSPPNSVVSL
jgi:hypothetical protein